MTSLTLRHGGVLGPGGVARTPLHIAGDRIADAAPGSRELDLGDHLIFPGLVNAHDHLQVNNVPPLSRSDPFPNSYVWAAAFDAHFGDANVIAARSVPLAARHFQGGLKNLLCGATTVAHHDPWHPVLDGPDFPVNLLRRFGWCHSLAMAPPSGSLRRLLSRLLRRAPRARHRLTAYGPPAFETFASTPSDAPWIIHLAEGTDAVADDELRQLIELRCFAPNTVLVHGVGLGDAGVDRIIQRGAGVIWCPASNLKLLGETLNPRRLFQAGRVALGTDARLSGSRDLLDELRVAASHSDLSPSELLRLVTTDAGRLLSIRDVGTLTPGARADFLVVRDTGADPHRRLLAQQRADLRAVFRDGRPAIADADLRGWFEACGVDCVPVTLDGRPKLLARAFARADAVAAEPGLQLE